MSYFFHNPHSAGTQYRYQGQSKLRYRPSVLWRNGKFLVIFFKYPLWALDNSSNSGLVGVLKCFWKFFLCHHRSLKCGSLHRLPPSLKFPAAESPRAYSFPVSFPVSFEHLAKVAVRAFLFVRIMVVAVNTVCCGFSFSNHNLSHGIDQL
jgi:hypothetical protein